MGEVGSGKSTLINILIGAKIAKECRGLKKVTEKINKYYINESNIALYDTPGLFESNINIVSEFVINFKEKLHCVIYLINNYGRRIFEQKQVEIIGYLLNMKIPIYFLINHSKKEETIEKKKIKLYLEKKY